MKVYSIFESIDGEVNLYYQGRVATFVRLAGCNLQCAYCDTKYAQSSSFGRGMTAQEVFEEIKNFSPNKVTITGGEPLMQRVELVKLLNLLYQSNYFVSIETNGSLPLLKNDFFVPYVVDYKLPSSDMEFKMCESVFHDLTRRDFVKFVISDKRDFFRAIEKMQYFKTEFLSEANFVFSPCQGTLRPKELVEWIQQYKLKDVIVNLQIHKIIWPDCGGKGGER